ncbi:hypothetical protein B9J78_06290 [bacterium Unc6]|nr:hypothetical protein [bacterium Unc6]
MKKKQDVINCLRDFFDKNKENYNPETVFLCGSWARGFPREDSDVDIGIVFQDNTLSDDKLFEIINNISLTLSSAINLEVNIIPIYWDFRKPMLYYNIIVLGVPVYIKDYNKYVDIRNEAIFQMEDFSIFGTDWQIQVAEKNIKEIS